MVKSRQRKSEKQINQSFIINSNHIWWNELIIGFFTLIVWIYCLTVIYFFVDALFSLNHEFPSLFRIIFKMNTVDVKDFLKIVVSIFLSMYLMLLIWSYYNKKRYGNLNRRKYPGITTKEDMMNLNILDEDIYEYLQNEKIIILEKNPIKNKRNYHETNI